MNFLTITSTKLSCLFWVLMLISACGKEPELCMTPYAAPVPADMYVYPLRPGMPAWATLTTAAQQVQALQLPDSVLRRISTPGLLATCLDYPMLPNMLAYNYLQRGAQATLATFNGFGQLVQRPEAAALLLDRYRLMTPRCLPPAEEQGAYSFSFSYLEMVLAQDEYLAQLTANQNRTLVREALSKYVEKELHREDVYGYFGLKTSAFVLARVMQAAHYAPFLTALSTDPDLQFFTTEAELNGKIHLLDTIVGYAKQFK